ncbi:MAG: protoporphyrinogen oxidase [Candidatus Koribacter versatilis]|uniref:Coproporphyrinogen III oxidase n=1 Tax=Candidatus Korobacter versatilis TaxID=658062 RepID=A0A932A997_9BACT|nr:protoporphyrinogen oxidase [Candidatus Koribacter versatilis]
MTRIAVIGGGIAGLSAAFRLEQKRAGGVEYALFEASGRLGGVIRTERQDGFIIEAGPDSFLSEKPWAAQLCRDLGIGSDLLSSRDHQRKTFILVNDRLIEMPDGLMFMVPTKLWPLATTSLFSLSAKLRAAQERWSKPRESGEDESVASFVTRHFGREMVERVAGPLLAGVYGGSAEKLSVRAVLPRFVTMERERGSLVRAMLEARTKMPVAQPAATPSLFTTLAGGMQQMTDAVAAKLAPASIRLDSPVRTLRRAGTQWTVVTGAGEQAFDAVILALPAYAAADLLGSTDSKLTGELRGIAYNSSITVALAYDAASIGAATRAKIEGFGFLVSQGGANKGKMLACTYVQNKFAGRAPAGKLLFRCFIGGAAATASMQLSDEDLASAIRGELRQVLGLNAEPLFTRVFRWPQAMAQYEVGHLDRVARIDQLVAQLPGLALAGNAYRGIGVPDCVREGAAAADRLLPPPTK